VVDVSVAAETREQIMKVFLVIAMMTPGVVQSVDTIEMESLRTCAEVRDALATPLMWLSCVVSAVPLPQERGER
jgi:hypothetical protein